MKTNVWDEGKGWVIVTLTDGTERKHEDCKRCNFTDEGLFIEHQGTYTWYMYHQIRSVKRCP